jgi:hypothetical protein
MKTMGCQTNFVKRQILAALYASSRYWWLPFRNNGCTYIDDKNQATAAGSFNFVKNL